MGSEIQLEWSKKFWYALHSRATNESILCYVSKEAKRKDFKCFYPKKRMFKVMCFTSLPKHK